MGAWRGDFQLSIGCDIDAHITPRLSGKGAPYLAASSAGQFAKHDNRVKRSGYFFASNICAHGHDIARAKYRYSVHLKIILCALYHRFDSCRGYGKLSVDVRVVPDEDDLLAVNLDDKPGGNAVPELPSERNSSTLEVAFVCFAGYGMLCPATEVILPPRNGSTLNL